MADSEANFRMQVVNGTNVCLRCQIKLLDNNSAPPHSIMKTKCAFTLIELLVAIAIIAVLVGLLSPSLSSVHTASARAQAMNNFKQLASGMILYAGEHDSELPAEGEERPTWQSLGNEETYEAWYNSIPRALGIRKPADFAGMPQAFYEKSNLLFVAAAKYPKDKINRPYFAMSMNSKLRTDQVRNVRLVNMQQPAKTVIFQESGLPGEKALPGQNPANYDGQPASFADRTVARYNGKTHMIFGDGHAELLDAKDVVNSNGLAYFPQIGENGGKVLWTLDPEADAN
jgi:prepilin-type N-terminal cleavage/methylation domain-containing protein/prepilin-type processing-associated H-X9-DG protein